MDKAFWKTIAANNYAIPDGYQLEPLIDELLNHLGTTDPEWRDEIAYTTLAYWIVHQPQTPAAMLRQMQQRLISRLSTGNATAESDDVFNRSFSMLVLGLIVYHDNENHILTNGEVETILFATLEYLDRELDLRGYVPGKGWAHAVAHTADTLKFLARNRYTNAQDHARMLQALANKVKTPMDTVLTHDEDERIAQVVLEIVKREEMPIADIVAWINSFVEWKRNRHADADFDPQVYGTHQNIKHLLRSLYFQLVKLEHLPPAENPFVDSAKIIEATVLKAVATFNF